MLFIMIFLSAPQQLRSISTLNLDAFNIDFGGRFQERLVHNFINILQIFKSRLFITILII